MSKQVDERVVSMQFDNKHFERNVQTSMSTLDKLKQKLNLTGASKGLENVNSAAKNVDMNGLASGVESVRTRFSALEVMGVTALANITNSAVNAGKKIVSALTIDPVKTGFQEYETQIGAVQTILANTKSKGSTIDDVNKALDTLNTYADKTIYNFTEMTRNIGTFTAAGVDLQTSVDSIQGIANLAAVSGSTSQQASTAMYQLSQALAAGKVSLMDWNSVVNAGMGGELFQNALIRTSELLKTGAKDAIDTYGSFRESLTKSGWLTTEVLTETLKQLSGAYTEADLIAQGFTASQAKEITELAQTATDAATKVKTFTQLWDVLKEAAQSGWAQTWELIIGDFEQAKEFFTPLAELLTGMIEKISNARNKIVEGIMGSPIGQIADKLSKFGDSAKKISGITSAVSEAAGSLEYYQKVVTDVWRGDYNNHGDNPDRYDLLDAAGYNHKVVQSLVNKGYLYELTIEDINEAQKKFGVAVTDSSKATADMTLILENLTDEQLKSAGLTEDEIKLFRQLAKEAKDTGVPLQDLIKNMEEVDGRTLLLGSFKNVANGLVGVFTSIREAWADIFPVNTVKIYGMLEALNRLTSRLVLVDEETGELNETGQKIKRTLKGIFAALDIVLTVVGGPIKIIFKAVTQLLGMFNLNILDVTASVGDAIVKFRDWVDSTLDFTKVFEKIVPPIKNAVSAFKDWISSLKDSKDLPKDIAKGIMSGLGKAVDFIGKLFGQIKDGLTNGFDKIPDNIISGFVKGIWNGIQIAGQVMVELGKMIIAKIKEVLGIHSPSTVFIAIGGFIIAGLILGITKMFPAVGDILKEKFSGIIEFVQGIDWGRLFSTGMLAGFLLIANKIADAVKSFSAPFEGIGEVLSGVGNVLNKSAKGIGKILKNTAKVVKSFSKVMNSISFSIKAKAVKDLALSLLILVGAIVVLTFIEPAKLWNAVAVVAALAAILVALSLATEKMSKASATVDKNGAKISGFKNGLLAIAASLLMVALAVKMIGSMDQNKAIQGFIGLVGVVGALVGLMAATKLVSGSKNVDKLGSTLLKISAALLVMVLVAKLASSMSNEELVRGGIAIAAFSGIIVGLMAATKLISGSKNVDGIGKTIFKIAGAILIMIIVAKLAASMSTEDLVKGTLAIVAFSGIIVGLMAATKLISGSKNVDKIGSSIFKISGALLAMVIVAKIAASMSTEDLIKGTLAITAFSGIIVGLMAATKLISGSKNVDKIGKTILMVSIAIGIIAGIAVLLSFIRTENLVKGIVAISALSAIIAGLIFVTKYAKNCTGNLVAISVAIGVIALSVAALSFIDPSKLAGATIALGMLMGIFALMIKASKNATKAMGGIIAMTVAIAIMVGAIYLLSGLPIESTITSVAALSILMFTMSGCLLILSKIGNSAKNALLGALALTTLAVPMLAFVGILALMQGVQNALPNVMALITLMGAMTLLLIPLTIVGAFGTMGLPYLGVLALLTMAVPMLAFVGILALMQNIQGATANTMVLIVLMKAMTDVLVKVSLVAPLALIAVAAITALIGVVTMFGVLVTAVGALMTAFPQLESFIDKGIPIMVKLANGIGEMIGAFIGGLAEKLASSLPAIGLSLSQFMMNAMPFIAGAKMVDDQVLKGVAVLAGAILALTAADLISGIASFLSGGSSFADLGTQLSLFMTNAMPFIMASKLIDPSIMEGVKTLSEAILILTAADVVEGLTSWFTGGSSLASFGAQLGDLGTSLNQFSTNIGTFSEEQVKTVDCAGRAVKALAESAKTIPNEGGLWGAICGENSLATFGSYLPALGTNMSQFVTNLGTFDDATVATVDCAGRAIKALAEAANEIPNEGGLWAKICGDNSLSTFGNKLPALGTNLNSFITNLGSFGEEQIATVDCAGRAIKALSEAADTIPNEGGFWAKIFGDNSISTFGDKLPGLGTNLNGFISNLGSFGEAQINTTNSAVKAINAFAKLGDTDFKGFNSGLSKFGDNIVKFAKKLKSFVEKLNEVGSESITTAINTTKDLVAVVKSIKSSDAEAAKSFGDALKKLGDNGITKFVNAVSGDASIKKVKDGATKLINSFVTAAKGKSKDIENAFKTVVSKASSAIKTKENQDKFKSAGKYLGDGLVEGIKAKYQAAYDAGYALGQKAVQGEKDGQQSESPSKATKKAGKWLGEGLIIGINQMGNSVYKAGESMGERAIGSISSAISAITDLVDSDIDTQPTIRPVVDLSNVSAGAGAINGMFEMTPSVGVLSNVRSISSMMNGRQNGSNDVVSAINDLKKTLGDSATNIYNVNGVTYDDGSNVSDAVKSLVRAAKVERRS